MNRTMTRRLLARMGLLATTVAAVLAMAAVPAFAHVTVHPGHAEQGSYAKLTFRVPNEESTASTTKLVVTMPTEAPIPHVSVKPHPGWSFQVKKTALDEPIRTEHGSIRQVVSRITWRADSSEQAIEPGEFDEFAVSAGPLPSNATALRFPAVQTYSNGDVVRWIETAAPGAPEPDHPAPSLELHPAAAPATEAASTTTGPGDGSEHTITLALAIAALVVALGTATTTGYLAVRRRH
jgi:uncharacterized protein